MKNNGQKPTVLVIGSTGQVGRLLVEELVNKGEVNVRVTSRRKEDVDRPRNRGVDAVYLDLDNPETLALALAGVDRAFLSTAVAMLFQTKYSSMQPKKLVSSISFTWASSPIGTTPRCTSHGINW